MIQARFSLEEPQVEFLGRCEQLGFKDKSAMVRGRGQRCVHGEDRPGDGSGLRVAPLGGVQAFPSRRSPTAFFASFL